MLNRTKFIVIHFVLLLLMSNLRGTLCTANLILNELNTTFFIRVLLNYIINY